MKVACDATKATECGECGHGLYTASRNYLKNCHVCRDCSSTNHKRKVKDCTAQENAVCECVAGYYCSNDDCEHCLPLMQCPTGHGVEVQATRTTDITCTVCGNGNYSSVTDSHSPCIPHTRCEDIGRELKIPGTSTNDSICGDFKHQSHQCHWILPACLWSGLVLTAFILFGLLYWRKKRKSYRAVSTQVPVTLIEMVPSVPESSLELPYLPIKEPNGYCQESCTVDGCHLPPYNPDDINGYTHDSVDNCCPITPLKSSVSFVDSNHGRESPRYHASNFHRTHSEPQEDEWCGT